MVAGTIPVPFATLHNLPLQSLHMENGARLHPFAGFNMPVHYSLGILGEHRHTRAAAGLFDVSHMGQIVLRARSGNLADAAQALETILPIDVNSLAPGRQRYALLTNEAGGVRDDLMVANHGSFLHLVVNAACTQADHTYLLEHLSDVCVVELMLDQALIAIQGPTASAALATLFPSVATMRFMDATSIHMQDAVCFITRSGYTGEDGFEISAPATCIGVIAERLLEHITVKLAGIGARDSLRLEAGLCLYGQDLGVDTTPVEAALQWAIPPVRRTGGARAGGFPGAQRILSELTNGPQRRRVGLRPELRPVREGAALFADCASDGPVGHVTSGSFGPSINSPIAMAYVPSVLTQVGTRLFAEVRGQRTPVVVSPLPFVAHRYFR